MRRFEFRARRGTRSRPQFVCYPFVYHDRRCQSNEFKNHCSDDHGVHVWRSLVLGCEQGEKAEGKKDEHEAEGELNV